MQELQDFLKENKMDFDTEAPKVQIEAAKREKRKKKDGEGGEEMIACVFHRKKVVKLPSIRLISYNYCPREICV